MNFDAKKILPMARIYIKSFFHSFMATANQSKCFANSNCTHIFVLLLTIGDNHWCSHCCGRQASFVATCCTHFPHELFSNKVDFGHTTKNMLFIVQIDYFPDFCSFIILLISVGVCGGAADTDAAVEWCEKLKSAPNGMAELGFDD